MKGTWDRPHLTTACLILHGCSLSHQTSHQSHHQRGRGRQAGPDWRAPKMATSPHLVTLPLNSRIKQSPFPVLWVLLASFYLILILIRISKTPKFQDEKWFSEWDKCKIQKLTLSFTHCLSKHSDLNCVLSSSPVAGEWGHRSQPLSGSSSAFNLHHFCDTEV